MADAGRIREMLDRCIGKSPQDWERILSTEPADVADEVRAILQRAEAPPDRPGIAPEHRIGMRVGKYEVVSFWKLGGMGQVYKGCDSETGEAVAVKFVKHEGAAEADRASFRAEQASLAKLVHPGIARFLDAGIEGNEPYIVMEFIDGRNIAKYSSLHGLTIRQRIQLVVEICDAVQYAHAYAIQHRDLKPSNILVTTKGMVKVIDFGLAGGAGSSGDPPTDVRAGTFPYASPEQAAGLRTTNQSDVYSLAAVLYELLSGRPTFDDPQFDTVPHDFVRERARRERIRLQTPLLASQRCTGPDASQLRGDLDCILEKALERDLDKRYSSVELLRDDLERYLKFEPVEARAASFMYKSTKYIRKHWKASGALLLPMAALGFSLWRGHKAATYFELGSNQPQAAVWSELARQFLANSALQTLIDQGVQPLGPYLASQRRFVEAIDGTQNVSLSEIKPDLAEAWWRLARGYKADGDRVNCALAANRAAQRFEEASHERMLADDLRKRRDAAQQAAKSCETTP